MTDPESMRKISKRIKISGAVLQGLTEGEDYKVLAYTDWADLFIPTTVKWGNGNVDSFTDLGASLNNRHESIGLRPGDPCPNCMGTGFDENDLPCGHCRGTGQIPGSGDTGKIVRKGDRLEWIVDDTTFRKYDDGNATISKGEEDIRFTVNDEGDYFSIHASNPEGDDIFSAHVSLSERILKLDTQGEWKRGES